MVQSSKIPRILLDFTSAQSLIEREWEPYGSEENRVYLRLEYDTRLGKRVLVKGGYGTDAGVRYKTSSHPSLDWRFSYYELVVQLHPESVICINVLDNIGQNHTLLYSSAILPFAMNQWEEFHIPLDKSVSERTWHSLLIDLPAHMKQANWPGFVKLRHVQLCITGGSLGYNLFLKHTSRKIERGVPCLTKLCSLSPFTV